MVSKVDRQCLNLRNHPLDSIDILILYNITQLVQDTDETIAIAAVIIGRPTLGDIFSPVCPNFIGGSIKTKNFRIRRSLKNCLGKKGIKFI